MPGGPGPLEVEAAAVAVDVEEFAGEVLDIDGDCGGFNLQWAWSSGHAAGTGAAVRALKSPLSPVAGGE